jgi:hypothetical protein
MTRAEMLEELARETGFDNAPAAVYWTLRAIDAGVSGSEIRTALANAGVCEIAAD